jgi:hypothetical protein
MSAVFASFPDDPAHLRNLTEPTAFARYSYNGELLD